MPQLRDMLTPDVLAGLERFIESQEVRDEPAAAINGILADWLTGSEFMPYVETPEGETDPDRTA